MLELKEIVKEEARKREKEKNKIKDIRAFRRTFKKYNNQENAFKLKFLNMSEKAFQQKWNAVNDYKMCEPEDSEGSEDSEDYS